MGNQPKPFDATTLARLRGRLELEHGRWVETLRSLERDRRAGSGPLDPGDSVDAATPKELGDVEDELLARARRQLVEIERALARMDEGTYGLSMRSGEPIPLARLEAIPWATSDVDESR
jgi:DnaK suppressor protein